MRDGMHGLADSPAKPGPGIEQEAAEDGLNTPPIQIGSLPEDLLAQVFALLRQDDRAATALVCHRWARVGRESALMWPSATLCLWLCRPSATACAESFVSWLIPRAATVRSLVVLGRCSTAAAPPAAATACVWSDVVGALVAGGPHLRELTVEWPCEVVLGGWVAALRALRVASFSAPQVVVRPGLATLGALRDLRFRSTHAPLALGQPPAMNEGLPAPSAAPRPGPQLLPLGLLNLRMDACSLSSLPPSISALSALSDLVLSNNELQPDDLAPLRALRGSLRQLTLMGSRMAHLPHVLSTLTALRVLYLDGVAGSGQGPAHEHICEVLGPLRALGVLSLGSSRLEHFPPTLSSLTSLRALYLDNNAGLASLPDGPYLSKLGVLGLDWRVLFASHAVLRGAPRLHKLCLTSIGGVEQGPHSDADAEDVSATLVSLPALRLLLLPMVDGNRLPLRMSPLNVALRLAACPRVEVRAVGYADISNEWNEWLTSVEEEEQGEEVGRQAAAAAAGQPKH